MPSPSVSSVISTVRLEKQRPGAEMFGGVSLRFELVGRRGEFNFHSLVDPSSGLFPDPALTEEEVYKWCNFVKKTVAESLGSMKVVQESPWGYAVTLLSIAIHPVDTSDVSMRRVVEQAINDAFDAISIVTSEN